MSIDTIEIAKLELQDGDILVVRTPPAWTLEQQRIVSEVVHRALHLADVNVPVLLGTTDIDFQVVRKDAA